MSVSARVGAIEITADHARIVVVKTGGRVPSVLEAHEAQLPKGDNEEERLEQTIETLRELKARLKHKPSVYALTASSQWGIVRVIRVPFKKGAKVAAAVSYELEPYLAFPIEELTVTHLPLREVDGETDVLAVGVRREPIEEQIAWLSAAGFSIQGVGIDAAGLALLWQGGNGGKNELRAALHVREHGAVLTVAQGRNLLYFRHIALSASMIQEHPHMASREVLNSLRGFQADWGASEQWKCLTVTGVSFFPEEQSLFEGDFTMPVEYRALLDKKVAKVLPQSGDLNVWEGPIGTAMSLCGGPMHLDFMTSDMRVGGGGNLFMRQFIFAALVMLICGGGYLAMLYGQHSRNQAALEGVGQQIYEVFKETFPEADGAAKRLPGDAGGHRSYDEMAKAYDKVGQQRIKAPGVEAFQSPPFLDVLRDIAVRMPDSTVRITNIQLTNGRRPEIIIRGESPNAETFTKAYEALKQSEIIEVTRENRESRAGKETFTIYAHR